MIRAIALFCLGVLIGACSGPLPQTPANKEQVRSLEAKTVALVHVREDGSAKAFCSGVWVGAKTILTASHCVSELALNYAVKTDVLDGAREIAQPSVRSAVVSIVDEDHDLALLTALGQTPPHEIARVSFLNIYPGAKAMTMGHPLGLWWSYSSGEISGIRYADMDPSTIYVQTTAPTSRGNSGCGLFDVDGNLIGIAHAGIPSASNLAFYVHGQYVRDLLVKHGVSAK